MSWLSMLRRLLSTPMVGFYRAYFIKLNADSSSQGATNYRGQIVFTGEGQGNDTPPALFVMNPVEPYNTTGMSIQGFKFVQSGGAN